jgi:hypothetical protein
MAFVVEKAINYNNITNHNTITAEVVNVYGDLEDDFDIHAGVLKKYKGAHSDVVIPSITKIIGKEAFRGLRGLTSVVIPEGVNVIEDRAFGDCSSLTSVTIPSTMSTIGASAFYGCAKLASVDFPSSVVSIGEYAFWSCKSLTSITIPPTVRLVRDGAFAFCSALTEVEISGSTERDDYKVFDGTPYWTEISARYTAKGLCRFCGGQLNIFDTCRVCNRIN